MKITFEFDTCGENFEMEELARFNKALDMAKALERPGMPVRRR